MKWQEHIVIKSSSFGHCLHAIYGFIDVNFQEARMSDESANGALPPAPKGASWVERVVRPDIGFSDRVKYSLGNSATASGGWVGHTLLGRGDSGKNR